MMPFAIAGLPALLAIFIGLATLGLHVVCRRLKLSGLARVLAFAMLWTIFEYLRGHILTGFPWNLIGYSWTGFLPVLQSVAVIGIYGLGLLTVAVASLPALLPDPSESVMRARVSLACRARADRLDRSFGLGPIVAGGLHPGSGSHAAGGPAEHRADAEMGARRAGAELRTAAGTDRIDRSQPAPPRSPM